jgi:NADPH-dependent curcumin reductase CurA
MSNRCLRLESRPTGAVTADNVKLSLEPIPTLPSSTNDEIFLVVRNLYASIDPTHRIWMADKAQYMDKIELGDIIRAATVGVITESSNEEQWPVGTHVVGFGGLCDYYLGIVGKNVMYVAGKNQDLPLTADLSVCSIIIGLAAWHGINHALAPSEDDIVVISGAAGAVGSLAGQIAKHRGCKQVIGIAGGSEKCTWITQELGFDAAIDYKSQNVEETLKTLAPTGITCYFDNVGGDVTDAVLMNTRNNARVAICGSISEYNDQWTGIKNFNMVLMRRLMVQGFICTDHFYELEVMRSTIASLVSAGVIKYMEDVREGLENFVDVVNLLFTGQNTGKLILKINDA